MTSSPGSRRPAGGAPGSKQLRRSWPGSPTAQESRQAGHRGRRLRAGRRDDDAPEAGLTGTLFQRQLTTARAPPPRRGSPTDGASDPGPHPDSPGADAQTDGATGATGPGLAPAPRPRRPPLVGDGVGKPSFGAFPRLSARSYRGFHQLNGSNREKISVNRAPRPAPAHRAPAQRGVR